MNKKSALFLVLIFLGFSKNCLAWIENEKLWLAVNSAHVLSDDKRWLSFIYSRLEFISQDHPWQAALLEGGVGYKLPTETSFWFGYRWIGNNPYNDFFTENRLFQQIIWEKKLNKPKRMIFRSRLEEIQRVNQGQISARFRQRIALEWENLSYFNKIFPFIYEEIFLQLNKTNYTSQNVLDQNRIFLGFNFRFSKNAWWEIGYINQIIMHTPINNQNQMNHIVSLTYNLI